MSLAQAPLTIIVAATSKNGIGKNGALPWPMLKKEMAYFARVTKRVPMPRNTGSVQSDATKEAMLDGARRNVVIMGRKTWDSIPPKFRPLKDRTNVVISTQSRSQLADIPDDVVVASDIVAALRDLERLVKEDRALPVGRTFVIGGSSIYEKSLALPQTSRILLTRIHKEYDCDAYFPADLAGDGSSGQQWSQRSRDELQDFVGEVVPEGLITETADSESVQFEYQLFEREQS